jgi:pyruvate formate-lyase activating enzyme-like uncharacterized protein
MEFEPLRMLPMASRHRGALSPGCRQCQEGKKLVLFVTGICRFRCFYCPVSERRNQFDAVYANERLVTADQDLLDEARAMGAEGTGVTGGDPLGVVERTEHFIRLLKSEFGADHHIHLYTHEPNPAKLARLARAGLDEFRLHIPEYVWGALRSHGSAYRNVLLEAPGWGVRRGVEIPVLPDKEAELRRLLVALDELGLDFINLNEMEFSATNERQLHARGYALDPRNGWGVRGSRAAAERVMTGLRTRTPIHFCSSRFKDAVQLRQRLLRRAQRTAPAFAEHTGDGTIRLGIVELPALPDWAALVAEVRDAGRLAEEDYRVDATRRRVELAPARLRGFARRLRMPAFWVEEYPTSDRLEVERTPLNSAAFPGQPGGT